MAGPGDFIHARSGRCSGTPDRRPNDSQFQRRVASDRNRRCQQDALPTFCRKPRTPARSRAGSMGLIGGQVTAFTSFGRLSARAWPIWFIIGPRSRNPHRKSRMVNSERCNRRWRHFRPIGPSYPRCLPNEGGFELCHLISATACWTLRTEPWAQALVRRATLNHSGSPQSDRPDRSLVRRLAGSPSRIVGT
jgi:hypothetical protein